ncbi:hypothetical protein F4776DRAFT_612539, partial [Hypoxylon sp. NC0597]
MLVSQREPGKTVSRPQPQSPGRFEGSPEIYSLADVANQPGFPSSPILRAISRSTSLPSTHGGYISFRYLGWAL